jgi:hypothetical protein
MPEYAEGPHRCEVVGQGYGVIEKTGTQFFGLDVLPEGGTFQRTIRLWVNSEANIERAKARLIELGWDGESWCDVNPGNSEGHSFIGLTLDLVNRHRDGYDDFDFPGPPGGGGSSLADDDELAEKLDRLEGRGKKKAKKSPPPKAKPEPEPEPEPVASPANPGDDEVPF